MKSRSCSLVMSGAIPEVCGDLPVEKGSWLSSGQALVDISGKKNDVHEVQSECEGCGESF